MRRYSATQLTRAQLSADCLPHSKPRVCLGTLRMRFSTTTPAARVSDRFLHRGKETGRLVKIASESEVAWVGRKQKKTTKKRLCCRTVKKPHFPTGRDEGVDFTAGTHNFIAT